MKNKIIKFAFLTFVALPLIIKYFNLNSKHYTDKAARNEENAWCCVEPEALTNWFEKGGTIHCKLYDAIGGLSGKNRLLIHGRLLSGFGLLYRPIEVIDDNKSKVFIIKYAGVLDFGDLKEEDMATIAICSLGDVVIDGRDKFVVEGNKNYLRLKNGDDCAFMVMP